MTEKLTPFLWLERDAEAAAEFYVSLFPGSRIDGVKRAPQGHPTMKEGDALVVQFTLAGRPYAALNGGPYFALTEAFSIQIDCGDQAEVDRYWNALIADGGSESMCGWCKDRFGLSWQVLPRRLVELLGSDDKAAVERTMQAMFTMRKLDVAALEAAARRDR